MKLLDNLAGLPDIECHLADFRRVAFRKRFQPEVDFHESSPLSDG